MEEEKDFTQPMDEARELDDMYQDENEEKENEVEVVNEKQVHDDKKVEYETVVDIKEFDAEKITLWPYNWSKAISIDDYLKMGFVCNAAVRNAYSDGVHSMEECMKYINDMARKQSNKGFAAVDSDLVFKWAINYYMSPVVTREKKVKITQPALRAETEEQKKAREEAERQRKMEDERKAEEKRKQEDLKKNGFSLFD